MYAWGVLVLSDDYDNEEIKKDGVGGEWRNGGMARRGGWTAVGA